MSTPQVITADLVELLDEGDVPIYIVDDRRRIVYCNPICARWLGVLASTLLGQRCDYHSGESASGPAAVAAGLCPPPRSFAGTPQMALVSCADAEGQVKQRRGWFLPLGNGQDESAPVIAVLATEDCDLDATPGDWNDLGTREADAELHEHVRRFQRRMAGRFHTASLIGVSPAIVRARTQIELAARSMAHVVFVGPAGAGKDHAARTIHYAQREPGQLVPLAVAAVDPNLLRSTLRALVARKAGQTQSGGTLLLDSADQLPAEVQADLLEMLGSGSLRMRVIALAALPLTVLAAEGRFSPELAGRLSTLVIELPPLAERLEDLPLLAQAFLEEVNAAGKVQAESFTSEALDQLAAYAWPGNLDELAVVVRQSHAQSSRGQVTASDLAEKIRQAAAAAAHPRRADEAIVLPEFLETVEKELIVRALRRAKGNKSKAARLLGLTRPKLYRRLVQLGLEPPREA